MKKVILLVIILSSTVIVTGVSFGIWLGIRNSSCTSHPNENWPLTISGNIIGNAFNISITELLEMPSYKQDYTLQGGSTYTAKYEGVKISYLFQNIISINPSADTVTLKAEDGYQLTFTIDFLIGNEAVIIAFKKNGKYLDSLSNGGEGYLRLIIPQINEDDFNGQYCLKHVAEIIFN